MPANNLRDVLVQTASHLKIAPSNQNTISEALNLIKNENSSLMDVIKILSHDVGVTAKIIGIANSAYFRIGMPVNTLERAILNIGLKELKSILFCLYYLNIFTDFLHFKKRHLHYMLSHSIFVALASKLLAKRTDFDDPEEVFTVALLHDIGKIVLFIKSEFYERFIDESKLMHEPVFYMEKEKFGIDHQELGYIMGLKWGLPYDFLFVIKNHHNALENQEREQLILRLVQESDRFFYNRNEGETFESYVLYREKDNIVSETENILAILEN